MTKWKHPLAPREPEARRSPRRRRRPERAWRRSELAHRGPRTRDHARLLASFRYFRHRGRSSRVFRLPGMRRTARLRHAEIVSLRCLLVDDSRIFLETARSILGQQGVTVAGIASSAAEALRQASLLRPDVAVVDIGLGGESGFDLARDLVKKGIAVILTSTSAAEDYGDLVAENPAVGFLPKAELSAAGIQQILGRPGLR